MVYRIDFTKRAVVKNLTFLLKANQQLFLYK